MTTITQDRPRIDPEINSHEGFDDAEIAAVLELHAARLDKVGMHGIAFDVREGAARLLKLSEKAA